MTVHAFQPDGQAAREGALASLGRELPGIAALALHDDINGQFASHAVARMRDVGILSSVLPLEEGGAGLGTDRHATVTLFHVLSRLGAAHLSAARLFEGHVNAFGLLWQYGTATQRSRLLRYVREGGLLGVWNAPEPGAPLRLLADGSHFRLSGSKIHASGAGAIRRPLLTAQTADDRLLMVWCDVGAAQVDTSGWRMQGMRATATGTVHLDGVVVDAIELFGADGDYHRQPAFSGGAWRFLAAQLGAAGALVDAVRQSLNISGRGENQHQSARLAEASTRLETGRLWTQAAARMADDPGQDPHDVVIYTAMARLVVEEAAMAIVALAQRSIGLRSLHEDHAAERIARDLATYLRQPAPDALRDAVAADALKSHGPMLDRWH
ncbi:acyl-CoA dehydrogenase family protein [Bacillus sp. NP157]|nr:acyl-CoA dehydrogenase family protein [Bacillus sp. NP157]